MPPYSGLILEVSVFGDPFPFCRRELNRLLLIERSESLSDSLGFILAREPLLDEILESRRPLRTDILTHMASIVTHVQSCSQENCESFISPFPPRHSYYNAGVQRRRPPRFLARSLARNECSLAVQHVFFGLGDRPRHRQHLGLRQRQRHCG